MFGMLILRNIEWGLKVLNVLIVFFGEVMFRVVIFIDFVSR